MSRLRNASVVAAALVAVFVVAGVCLAQSETTPWGREVEIAVDRPMIWQEADGKDILAAEEVARNDAYRKLLARIYGFRIDAETDILDLVLEDQRVGAAVFGKIKGMKELAWKYYEDGRCEVAVQVTIREIVETVTSTYEKYKKQDKAGLTEKITRRIETECKDTNLIEVGNGALVGTLGLKRIRARRAAELDAYRQLAQKVVGLRIDSVTTVRDFVLAEDIIQTKLTSFLKGVRFTDARYTEQIAQVDGEITIRQIVSFLKRCRHRYLSKGKWTTVAFDSEELKELDTIIGVTGKAAITDETALSFERMEEGIIELVIETKVISREVGVIE